MTRRCRQIALCPVAALLAALVLLGCEESVDPVIGTDAVYTLYGFLDPSADTQAVRVYPVEGRLALQRPEPLGAQVRSEARREGGVTVWADSVVAFSNGRYGHVYWARFRPDYDAPYAVVAEHPDGRAARVEVRVPPLVTPRVDPPDVGFQRIDVPVRWPGAPTLNQVEVLYRLAPDTLPGPVIRRNDLVVDYAYQQEPSADGWTVTVNFLDDAQALLLDLIVANGGPLEEPPVLCDVEVRVLVSSEGWEPPGGRYDPELLVEPGTFSNVEGGFGFVGAGYLQSAIWEPPPDLLQTAGFDASGCGETAE